MPTYDRYPGIDETYNFPPEVIAALADNSTFGNLLVDTLKDFIIDDLHLVANYIVGAGQTWTDLDTIDIPQSGILAAQNTALNRPKTDSTVYVVAHLRFQATRAVQLAFSMYSNKQVYYRVKTANYVWTPWLQIASTDMLTDMVTVKRAVHLEDGKWIWDGAYPEEATHYVMPETSGRLVVFDRALPTPGTSPELNW